MESTQAGTQQFKPGDKVRCIEGASGLRRGAEYVVIGMNRLPRSPQTVKLEDVGSWYARRFELVTPPPAAFNVGDTVRLKALPEITGVVEVSSSSAFGWDVAFMGGNGVRYFRHPAELELVTPRLPEITLSDDHRDGHPWSRGAEMEILVDGKPLGWINANFNGKVTVSRKGSFGNDKVTLRDPR